jgi:glycosyltransferase involved in cell wall biosynthesis
VKVVAVTTWFPTARAPSRGSFVVRDLQAISHHDDVRVVHLVSPADDDGSRRLLHEGLDVLRVPMDPTRPDQVLAAARTLHRALVGADVVHSMAFSSLLPFAVRRPRVPWVHTEHWSALTTPGTLPAPARAGLPVLSQLLSRPDHVTAVCDFLAQPVRAVRRTRPTSVVPCIVEPGPVAPRRDRADGSLRLVSTGGLIDRKDPLVAVRTLAELAARGVDAHLTWLGDGPLKDQVLALAEELGVTDRLRLPGTVDADAVRAALAAADMFFGPTRADNFFVSAAEALVAGRPVVLGSTGGQGEYVDGSVGVLVGVQDPVRYADAIVDLDARTRSMPADRIAATIGDRFSAAHVGRAYHDVYERTLGLPRLHNGATRPVEVVIACHTPERPVGRAVASVLDGNGDVASVTVVCHNRSAAEIAAAIDPRHRDAVRLIEHRDGFRSASGPFNAGMDRARAPYVAIMGSDDILAPGAVAAWLTVARRTGAEFVITRLALGDADHGVPTPAVRMHRAGRVDLVRDRLAYRSAPLGLMSVDMLRRGETRLVEGAPVGGDVGMVTELMATSAVAYDRYGPPYVIGEDASDRVTYVVRPISEQLGFFPGMLSAPWFWGLSRPGRRAVGIKMLRIHVFGAVFYRPDPEIWTTSERADLASIAGGVLAAAPGCERPLSRADRRLLDACLDPRVPAEELIAAAEARRHHGRPATLVPRPLLHVLDREAPLRFMTASVLVQQLPRLAGRLPGRGRR